MADLGASKMTERVSNAVDDFTGDAAQSNGITIVTIHYLEAQQPDKAVEKWN